MSIKSFHIGDKVRWRGDLNHQGVVIKLHGDDPTLPIVIYDRDKTFLTPADLLRGEGGDVSQWHEWAEQFEIVASSQVDEIFNQLKQEVLNGQVEA